jgi:hypothetical protein
LSKSSKKPYECITWGTLMRAAYRAFDEHPTNDEIIASRIAGMDNVTILHSRTPKDVVQWVRDYHNLWHYGSSCTFIQLTRESLEISAAWMAHCETSGTLAGHLLASSCCTTFSGSTGYTPASAGWGLTGVRGRPKGPPHPLGPQIPARWERLYSWVPAALCFCSKAGAICNRLHEQRRWVNEGVQ